MYLFIMLKPRVGKKTSALKNGKVKKKTMYL